MSNMEHPHIQNEDFGKIFEGISLSLSQFFFTFHKQTNGDTPFEATLTDILISSLLHYAGFTVKRTDMHTEGRVGHDLRIEYSIEKAKEQKDKKYNPDKTYTPNWICFLQAKVMKKGVVDFVYGYNKLKGGKAELVKSEKERLQKDLDYLNKKLDDLLAEDETTSEEAVDYYIGYISRKYKEMEGWGSSGKLQAQLLQETIHKAKEPQGENRPQVNGGYVVYDKLGVRFLPIDKVNELLLPEMQKQPLPNQNQLNSSVTKALLGSEEERESDDSKKWAKSVGLQTVLPENIRKLNGIMTVYI